MISELKLHNFRCFTSSSINLSPGINFFYGDNGSGKTSILEAIYMCSSGRSFKSSNIQSLISTDRDFLASTVMIRAGASHYQSPKKNPKPFQ